MNDKQKTQNVTVGESMYQLASELFPICRSITGNGVRKTLAIIKDHIPLETHEVPSHTQVFDWTVPREWNINDAYIKNQDGKRIVDFKDSNLHVVNYSAPVQKTLSLAELKEHLFTIPEHPNWIPYRTSYYDESWGFCLSHSQLEALENEQYEVCIDSSLEDGHLTYGEYVIPGQVKDEILLSAHVCHPSLANDNLSGITLLAHLAKYLQKQKNRYTYRFIFAPGTIGSITWLARNEDKIGNIKHGLVISCVGDHGNPTFKRSRHGNAEINRIVAHVLKHSCPTYTVEDFSPYGYDERQYCSPGIDLDVGLFERSKYGTFPEYHTSADNLDFIKPERLQESYDLIRAILHGLDKNRTYVNTSPKCEPQLGKRGLYSAIGGDLDKATRQLAMLWVLNQSDGTRSLLEIAERADMKLSLIVEVADLLQRHDLLRIA